jgi:hypothetical protein
MKYFLLFMFICGICYAGDYVCYDQDGKITSKHYSTDGSTLDMNSCIKVSRNEYRAITQYKKVENGKIVDMTSNEIAAIQLKKRQDAEKAEKDRVKAYELTSKELIDILIKKGVLNASDIKLTP